jgi:hypothetical protein
MAWNDLADKIKSILEDECGLSEAPEMFDVNLVPETLTDKTFCLWCDELNANKQTTTSGLDTYPIATFRIDISFNLGSNETVLRDEMMQTVEDAYQRIVYADNRSENTRMVTFEGAKIALSKAEGMIAIVEMRFSAEYKLTLTV